MENKIFLNRYRLSLGRNGLPVEVHRTPAGVTYRAQEIESGREVMLELVACPAPSPQLRERIESDVIAAMQLNHINIPVLHDFGFEDDHIVYVTEYSDGHTAEAWANARGPLAPGAALRVALQTVDALGAAAFHCIHHHALNPANILFVPGQTPEGEWPPIKVLHWLGPVPTFAPDASDARVNTAARFASPEQLRGERVDIRSEIYSLGATIWFLLTGAAPVVAWNGSGGERVRVPVEKLRGVPKILRHLLGRMLRSNPEERPHDPVALAAYLQTCLARIERKEKMGRRFGLPLATAAGTPRAIESATNVSLPYRRVVLAASLLVCAILAGLMFAGRLPARHEARALPATQQPAVATAPEGTSTQRVSMKTRSAPAVEQSPSPRAVIASRDEAPARAPRSSVAESAPPEEGPQNSRVTSTDTIASVPPPRSVPETQLPTEPAAASSEEPPIIAAETQDARPENQSSGDLSAESSPENVAAPNEKQNRSTIARTASKSSLARSSGKKSSRRLAAKRSKTHHVAEASKTSQQETAVAATGSKSHHTIPALHVGSSPARFVGTTADGKWILTVASSGRRIVVPPPPGFSD